jgi:hypothetical protein
LSCYDPHSGFLFGFFYGEIMKTIMAFILMLLAELQEYDDSSGGGDNG